MTDSLTDAAAVLRRCDELAAFSEEEGRLTRRFATPALRLAGETVGRWMEAAGMTVHRDAIGNVIGRLGDGARRTLLIGSHIDTVPDAGRYDGVLGVLVGIAAVERVADALPYAVEVIAFADEEGVRYGTGFLGSSVLAGRFDAAALERRDADGVSLGDAVRGFGGDPDGLAPARREQPDLIGYYEVHIEQGPALESAGVPLGVVTGIAGQSGGRVVFTGEAGHAGTVPMTLRRDALCAAAEFVTAVEAVARDQDGAVATVGRLEVEPGARNVIPARAVLSLDVRHADDSVREAALTRLHGRAGAIADVRGVRLDWQLGPGTPAMACSPDLSERVAKAVQAAGHDLVRLPSGAGHDAAMLATITPVAMLFVRCAGGISHNPAESVTIEDVAAAIDVTTRFLESLA